MGETTIGDLRKLVADAMPKSKEDGEKFVSDLRVMMRNVEAIKTFAQEEQYYRHKG